jgi:hypothetical protein
MDNCLRELKVDNGQLTIHTLGVMLNLFQHLNK